MPTDLSVEKCEFDASSRGVRIPAHRYPAQGVDCPRAVIIMSHGYGEHVGRYRDLVECFVSRGFEVYDYDLRGHGSALGRRACADVNHLVADLSWLRQQIKEQLDLAYGYDTMKIVLFGHSLGGLITAASALHRGSDIDGVILSSPTFLPAPSISSTFLRKKLLPKLSRLLPILPVGVLNPELLTHDKQVNAEYVRDPDVFHGYVPFLTGGTMLEVGARTLEFCGTWDADTLIVHGTSDSLSDIAGSRRFTKHAGKFNYPYPTVELFDVKGGYHELFKDTCKDEVLEKTLQWLDDRFPLSTSSSTEPSTEDK